MIHKPAIRRIGDAAEQDGILVVDQHFEILSGFQMHLLPHQAGQDNLAFFGENRGHGGKILPLRWISVKAILESAIGPRRGTSPLACRKERFRTSTPQD